LVPTESRCPDLEIFGISEIHLLKYSMILHFIWIRLVWSLFILLISSVSIPFVQRIPSSTFGQFLFNCGLREIGIKLFVDASVPTQIQTLQVAQMRKCFWMQCSQLVVLHPNWIQSGQTFKWKFHGFLCQLESFSQLEMDCWSDNPISNNF
jgi:hypothetical protein